MGKWAFIYGDPKSLFSKDIERQKFSEGYTPLGRGVVDFEQVLYIDMSYRDFCR